MSDALQREAVAPRIHMPSLLTGLVIMVGGTVYPLTMANAEGRADHALAALLFWAMSAGFVRGVGFVPRTLVWRWLFSGWACSAALAMAAAVKLTG
ncbi:MAG: cyd operon YbgE family protein [Burkholderiales bacterium]